MFSKTVAIPWPKPIHCVANPYFLSLCLSNDAVLPVILEPVAPLIRDIWITDFDQFLEYYEIPYSFRASPLPEYTLHFKEGDSKLLCRSFENYSRIIGLNLSSYNIVLVLVVPWSIINKYLFFIKNNLYLNINIFYKICFFFGSSSNCIYDQQYFNNSGLL